MLGTINCTVARKNSLLGRVGQNIAFVELFNYKDQCCKNCAHISSISNLAENFISILLHCSEHCKRAIKSTNRILLSNELQILKLESINAHRCWVANNKLRSGDVHPVKVRFQLEYEKAIKAAKNNAKIVLSDKQWAYLISKNTLGFWSV